MAHAITASTSGAAPIGGGLQPEPTQAVIFDSVLKTVRCQDATIEPDFDMVAKENRRFMSGEQVNRGLI